MDSKQAIKIFGVSLSVNGQSALDIHSKLTPIAKAALELSKQRDFFKAKENFINKP